MAIVNDRDVRPFLYDILAAATTIACEHDNGGEFFRSTLAARGRLEELLPVVPNYAEHLTAEIVAELKQMAVVFKRTKLEAASFDEAYALFAELPPIVDRLRRAVQRFKREDLAGLEWATANTVADSPQVDLTSAVTEVAKKSLAESHTTAQPKATINERMQSTLSGRPEASDWTARQWACCLDCSVSSIAEAETWCNLEGLRKAKKAGLVKDRRRRTKGT